MNNLFIKRFSISIVLFVCFISFKNVNASEISVTPIHIKSPSISISSELNEELNIGSRGSSVERLQRILSSMDDIYPEKFVTGYYGAITKKAVMRFQQKYGLSIDGVVDEETLRKINEFKVDIVSNKLPVVSDIVSTPVGPKNTIISWKTDSQTLSEVYYSSKPLYFSDGYKLVVKDSVPTRSHTLEVTNLVPATRYYVKIISIDSKNMSRTVSNIEFTTLTK